MENMPEETQQIDDVSLAIMHYSETIRQNLSKPHFAVPHLEPMLDIYEKHKSHQSAVADALLPRLDEHIDNVKRVMTEENYFHIEHSDRSRVMRNYEHLISRLEKLRSHCA